MEIAKRDFGFPGRKSKEGKAIHVEVIAVMHHETIEDSLWSIINLELRNLCGNVDFSMSKIEQFFYW